MTIKSNQKYRANDYHGLWAAFRTGDRVSHVTDDGEICEGTITEVDEASLHIDFDDGEEGWECLSSCFKAEG